MKSFRGKALGLTSLWVIALELQLTATRCVNMPKAVFCCCYVYRRKYATYGQVVYSTLEKYGYAYCYVRNPVGCPFMSAQAFFITACIAPGERGLTLHERKSQIRNFAIPSVNSNEYHSRSSPVMFMCDYSAKYPCKYLGVYPTEFHQEYPI